MAWLSESNLDEFYRIRVTTDRPLSDELARRLFGCIGYAFAAHFRGERLGWPRREAANRWTASYDITKSRSDDWLYRASDALRDARRYAVEGTPLRSTQGGTRLVEGVGPIKLTFEFE